jgi:hypothetical protein
MVQHESKNCSFVASTLILKQGLRVALGMTALRSTTDMDRVLLNGGNGSRATIL